jgi:hypothetical protein
MSFISKYRVLSLIGSGFTSNLASNLASKIDFIIND